MRKKTFEDKIADNLTLQIMLADPDIQALQRHYAQERAKKLPKVLTHKEAVAALTKLNKGE